MISRMRSCIDKVPTIGWIIGLQSCLLLVNCLYCSPAFDEWGHLPSGLYHWQFADYRPYCVNPPLVRSLVAIPVWCLGGGFAQHIPSEYLGYRSEWRLAELYFAQFGLWTHVYMAVARLVVAAIACFGTWTIYLIGKLFYSRSAGLVASLLWATSPMVLTFGANIVSDIPLTVALLWAMLAFLKWNQDHTYRSAMLMGLASSIAIGCKLTGIFAPIAITCILLVRLLRQLIRILSVSSDSDSEAGTATKGAYATPLIQKPKGFLRTCPNTWAKVKLAWMLQISIAVVTAIAALNILCNFDRSFQTLGSFSFYSHTLRGDTIDRNSTNRFHGTSLENVRVPLPAVFLEGMDIQKHDFESKMTSYFFGDRRDHGWYEYYVVGIFLKEPVTIWAIFLIGISVLKDKLFRFNQLEICLALPSVLLLIFVSSQTGFNHHVRYVLPVFPIIYLFAGKVCDLLSKRRAITTALLCAYCLSSASNVPRSYAYFSEIVGGPKNGWKYLDNSNLDWGQDLMTAMIWSYRKEPKTPTNILYSIPMANFEGIIAGVTDGRPLLAKNTDGEFVPTAAGDWLVFAQTLTEPEGTWFRNQKPDRFISSTIRLYKVSHSQLLPKGL